VTVTAGLPGRDPRAVRHVPPPPRGPVVADPSAIVIGGGIAGMSAAVALAERGVHVTLLEQHEQLGGRVRAWPVRHGDADGPGAADADVTMSRGFHAFFRQYYNLRALLRRADPELRRLVPIGDYPLVSGRGVRDSFARIPRTPPWNMAAFVLRSPSFPLRALPGVDVGAALELLDVAFPHTFAAYDGQSAADFLDRLGFPDEARHLALEVFARSFFARPEDFAAGELVSMFHTYFLGSAEGLLFDVPDDDYDTALWAPLSADLLTLGVEIRRSARVAGLEVTTAGVTVATASGDLTADTGVLATDPGTARKLIADNGIGDEGWRDRVAATRNAPPFAVWRLWFREPVAPERPAFLGTAGFDLLDNISVVERFEHGAAEWARRTGGSVVELHAYALDQPVDESDVRRRLRSSLATLYPETATMQPAGEEWLLQDDCPLIGTAPWQERPEVRTSLDRLVLAGDWVRCDYPVALMERAATTGLLAANELLRRFGRQGAELWTVPMRGRHRIARPLRRLLGGDHSRHDVLAGT
jgi:isorenieratene synthase